MRSVFGWWRTPRHVLMALVGGLLVASVINLFLANSAITWIISLVGVGIFTVLTAYDVQRIQNEIDKEKSQSAERIKRLECELESWK